MATVSIPQLPSAIALTGPEQVEIVQAGTSARTTVSQIAALFTGGGAGGGFGTNYVTYVSSAGVVNNVSPSGFPTDVGRLDVTLPSGNATWTGLAAGSDNQALILRNADPANTLFLSVANSASFPINQFAGQAGTAALTAGSAMVIVYYGQGIDNWILVP